MRSLAIKFSSALLILVALHGCSPGDQSTVKPPSAEENPHMATVPSAPPERESSKACELVTQEEMSQILGSAVIAEANDRHGSKTECIYNPTSGISPYVELSVAWGRGEVAMMGTGMTEKIEPGIVSPYEGIGDQAVAIGPMLRIRTGEDLVTITFSGVEEMPAKAKQIFDTAKARMR